MDKDSCRKEDFRASFRNSRLLRSAAEVECSVKEDGSRSTSRRVILIPAIISLVLILLGGKFAPVRADELPYSLNVYAGRLTTNHWEDFFNPVRGLDFVDSYMAAATLARRIRTYENKAGLEIEGQIVKHFHAQKHLELNVLVTARWDSFWWDNFLDTSVAFGLGPSYATEKPAIEIESNGDTSTFLIYWMLELAVGLPGHQGYALITRIHHRSNAFGLVANEGGSNALVFGLKYRF